MSNWLDRASALLEQSRFRDAEAALRRALIDEPENGAIHALLATSLVGQDKHKPAIDAARSAVGFAPTLPYAHFALALAWYSMDEYARAIGSISEAIRLDPEDPDHFSLLAAIQVRLKQWSGALKSAETGLRLNPQHSGCLNARTAALTGLGRHEEASETVRAALQQGPEDAETHLVSGYACLHQGDYQKALEHFRETLRIDPTLDSAREGIVECLKARNPIYRPILGFFLWMSRQSGRFQAFLIIGAYILVRTLRGMSEQNPGLTPLVIPLTVVYAVFVLLSWTADALFNLLLRLHPEGRRALTREQTRHANWIGGVVGGAIALVSAGLITGIPPILMAGLGLNALIIPLAATFRSPAGWPRTMMGWYTAVLAGIGACAAILFGLAELAGEASTAQRSLRGAGGLMAGAFLLGSVFTSWIGNIIIHASPKKGFWRYWLSKGGIAILIFVALGILAFYLQYRRDAQADDQWNEFAAPYVARGEPLSIDEIEASRPAVPDDQNGALIIHRNAAELIALNEGDAHPFVYFLDRKFSLSNPHAGFPAEPLSNSRAFLRANSKLVDELLAARNFDRGRLPVDFRDAKSDLLKWRPPQMDAWRNATKVLAVTMLVAAIDGDLDRTADAIEAQLALAAFLEAEPETIAQVYAIASEGAAAYSLECLLLAGEPGRPRLDALLARFESRITNSAPHRMLYLDRARLVDMFDLSHARKIEPRDLGVERYMRPRNQKEVREGQRMVIESYAHVFAAAESFEALKQAVRSGGKNRRAATAEIDDPILRPVARPLLFHFRRLATLECCRAAIAGEKYRQDRGRFPEEWAELIPDYLPAAIADPLADSTLLLDSQKGELAFSSAGIPPELDALVRGNKAQDTKDAGNENQVIHIRLVPPASRGLKPSDDIAP